MVPYLINNNWQEIAAPDPVGILSNENDFKIHVAILPAAPTDENFFTYNAYKKVAFNIPVGSKLFVKAEGKFEFGKIRIDEDNLFSFPTTSRIIDSSGSPVTGKDGALRVLAGYGDLAQDAWGHQKVIEDVSLFSSAFTFNIDRNLWVPYEDGIEIYYDINLTRFSTTNGKLTQSSGAVIGQYSYLMGRRHPRYQPNRGHLYSSSIFLPNKAAIGERKFGLFNIYNGAFFSLEDGVLYAVVRTTINTATTEPFKQAVDVTDLNIRLADAGLPAFDLEQGNIYDIQMQWRGVGDIRWYIGDPLEQVSILVAEYNHLNTSTELSISNPSLPAAYECINTNGTEVIIEGGCIDVTTEGGKIENRSYAAFPSGEIATTLAETAIISLRIPLNIFGTMNTRDIILAKVDAYSDVDTLIRIYYFRDPTAITATFTPIRLGFQEAATNGAITAFDRTKMIQIFETRIPATDSKQFINPSAGKAEFQLIHGDYIFVSLQGKNNSLGGVTLEWAEEI